MNAILQISSVLQNKIKEINSIKRNLEIEILDLRNRQLQKNKIERNMEKLRECFIICRQVYQESISLSNYFVESNFNVSKLVQQLNYNYQKFVRTSQLQATTLRESRDEFIRKFEYQTHQLQSFKKIVKMKDVQISKKNQLIQKLKNNIKQLINKNNQTNFIAEETLNQVQSINIQEGYGQDICSRSPAIEYPPIRNAQFQKQNKKDSAAVSVSCWSPSKQKQYARKVKTVVSQNESSVIDNNTDIGLNKQSIDHLKKIIEKISLEEKEQLQKQQQLTFLENNNNKIQINLQPLKTKLAKINIKMTKDTQDYKQNQQILNDISEYQSHTTYISKRKESINQNYCNQINYFGKPKNPTSIFQISSKKEHQIKKNSHLIQKQNIYPLKTEQSYSNLKKSIQNDRRSSMYIPIKKQSSQSIVTIKRKFSLLEKKITTKQINEELKNLNFSLGDSKLELKYQGTKKNGVRDGKGKLWYINGFVYEGDFKENMRHGLGVLYLNERQIYRGSWNHDKLCGEGTLNNFELINRKKIVQNSILRNAYYNGSFYENKFNGRGTLFINEEKIIRKFINGLITQ